LFGPNRHPESREDAYSGEDGHGAEQQEEEHVDAISSAFDRTVREKMSHYIVVTTAIAPSRAARRARAILDE
jgi:hypothetical protein